MFPRLYIAKCAYDSLFSRDMLLGTSEGTLLRVTRGAGSGSVLMFIKTPLRIGKGLCGMTTTVGRNRVVKFAAGAFLPGCNRFCRVHRFAPKPRAIERVAFRKGGVPFNPRVLFRTRKVRRLMITTRVYRSI